MTTRRLPLCAFALLLALPLTAWLADAASAADAPAVTLEQIMAAPDWIGNPPENPYWGDDGKAVYYEQKRPGEEIRDLVRLDLQAGAPRVVPPVERGAADAAGGDWSLDRRRKVYARRGDVYLKDVSTGAVRQLTRTAEEETDPRFMAGDGRVSFRRGDAFFVYDLATGLLSSPADARLEKDPADEDDPAYLKAQQLRLFDVLRKLKRDRDQARAEDRAEQAADATRPPLPFYLGDKVKIAGAALSPAGDWLLLVTIPKPKEGEEAGKTAMPKYVTESGDVEVEKVRPKVGAPPVARSLTLLDLRAHRRYDLDLAVLPGILDDPLKEMRAKAEKVKAEAKKAREAKEAAERGEPAAAGKEEAAKTDAGKAEAAKEKGKPEPRPCDVADMEWSRDGRQVALQLRAFDNKDRWLATIDLASHRLVSRERLTDPAWVNWDHNDFGWLADNHTLWYLSERSGYSHLWAVDVASPSAPSAQSRQLTRGDFEVSAPVPSRDGRSIYYLANAGHPGIYEVWRLEVAGGATRQLTRLGGLNTFQLSPDERSLLLVHSALAHPDELYVQDVQNGGGAEAAARQVTHTVTDAFLAVDWTVPEIVAIPSTHVARPIYSRLYTPKDFDPARSYPAVVFVHGAGYLQDAHQGWSYYWHEFLFHTLLNQHGYVVLDMDYRASAGYGRDWRTAIYRQMGHPELEDLEDGVAWLAAHRQVDAKRVGVYGGSYGGFMTYMALFRAPDLFAAGAALRPVSDWAHYNEDYTGAILNTPELDPEAYAASSPIELAAGLTKPLLICDGVQDDNVLFQDNVRMVQRLIELKKENFEIAFYPLESHAFKQPTSWLDEYRRIFKLFEAHLKG